MCVKIDSPHCECQMAPPVTYPPIATRITKELMNRFAPPLSDVVEFEMAAVAELSPTDDFREAITSFMEKRTPVFHGR